jgi:segregation and condensation protein A
VYQVQLQEFDGPLDLLLFFIKRDELDIYNIPIAYITEQFLEYIHLMEELDLSIASEFIWMASTLMSIKAKMMLPREEADLDELHEEDPRFELMQALLEYKQIKEKAEDLHEMDIKNRVSFYRGFTKPDELEKPTDGEVLKEITMIDLMAAIKHVLSTSKETVTHKVEKTKTSIEAQAKYLRSRLSDGKRHSFVALCLEISSRPVVVVTFLATLEMIKEGTIVLYLGDSPTDFYLELSTQEVSHPVLL